MIIHLCDITDKFEPSIKQAINQSIKQSTNRSVDQSITRSTNQRISRSIDLSCRYRLYHHEGSVRSPRPCCAHLRHHVWRPATTEGQTTVDEGVRQLPRENRILRGPLAVVSKTRMMSRVRLLQRRERTAYHFHM